MRRGHFAGWFLALCVLGVASAGLARDDDDDAPKAIDFAPEVGAFAPKARMAAPSSMGATPGGAQDIDFARSQIAAGDVPHPATFTAEGLLSQHDLPLPAATRCKQILCVTGAATRADLLAQPEVRTLAQLGFASNLDPETWRRQPLSLVAVVDKSGSMAGQPLETVKASLRHIATRMGDRDELAIVLYGDQSEVHLPPTSMTDRAAVLEKIDAIASAGSTYLEEGLRLGYLTAFARAPHFAGTTRVMLFTDERPNVGRTDAESFMGMAREASKRDVGLTTIGVGTQFGAELATEISSVRGGNLFFFPDVPAMAERFDADFDVMVTELAYDLELAVRPAPGYELVGVYGLPGDLLKRTPDGGLKMTIETIFLSHEKGGIYFAFKPAGGGALPPKSATVAYASVRYLDTQKKRHTSTVAFKTWRKGPLPLGLARGKLLVDELTVLKAATELHRAENKTEEAYRLVHALRGRLEQSRVSGLDGERELVKSLDATLTHLAGHQGEGPAPSRPRDPVSGMPE